MSLVKIGESISITASDIQSAENVLSDPEIQDKFQKIAKELKIIAPKGDDFLYFSAVMMHAAEHSAINDDGSFKVTASGEPVKVWWEPKGESLIWKSNDPHLRPYKNNNSDIFPERELISAHKKWVGKPLCLDHKSSSVDMIRGLIVDTYYDHKLKRVVALCALDKKNYPDLARKVSTGYAASVSMGTGVGKAVCYDCGNVARTEHDFCSHMKTKSTYGEVNLDLNPIELSIVVNGADPKAKIKTIIAAANNIAKYVEAKEQEFLKKDPEESKSSEKSDKMEGLVSSLEDATKQLGALKAQIEELLNEGRETKSEDSEDSKLGKEASDKSSENALKSISDKLDTIFERINKLYSFNKDEQMTTQKKAYFQGGGGLNEPQTYPKEDADKIRNTQDKQMVGQMDTGPVDGMHPGYDSFGETEEARKRRLQRLAEEEMRSIRRQAALEAAKANLAKKQAYYQGGGGLNEPQTYPKEDADKIRNTQDKQMVGAPPFPDTGAVDGLFPKDLEKKQMLSRAKLTARFLKAAASNGNDDLANSRWEVFADKKLVFSASVNEITGGRANALYDSVANEGFGRSLIAKIRTNGLEKVASMYKSAQTAPAAPEAPAAPAAAAPPSLDMPELPAMEESAPAAKESSVGTSGDPAKDVPKLLSEMAELHGRAQTVLADLDKGVQALLTQSTAETPTPELEGLAESPALSPTTASLMTMQKKLGRTILAAMKETSVKLASIVDELQLAKQVLVKNASLEVRATVRESKEATREVLADAYTLMSAFSKYAASTEVLVKQAVQEVKMVKVAQDVKLQQDTITPSAPKPAARSFAELQKLLVSPTASPAAKKELEAVLKMVGAVSGKPAAASPKTQPYNPASLADDGAAKDHMSKKDMHHMMDKDHMMGKDHMMSKDDELSVDDLLKMMDADDDDKAYTDDVKITNQDGTTATMSVENARKVLASDDLTTKEGRAAYRAKQAAKAMQFSKILDTAHPKGGTVLSGMKGEGAKVETLEEIAEATHEVATKEVSAKTKKAAEDIQRLVVAGRIEASEVDQLVKAGLDAAAVKYWKDFYGQAKDKASKEFAAELTAAHSQAKKAENMESYRVKIARAYDLANEMAMKGLIGRDKHAIKEQVDELMSFNDAGFDSMKKHVERTPMTRTASYAMPQIGLMSEELIATASGESNDLVTEFAAAFANRKY